MKNVFWLVVIVAAGCSTTTNMNQGTTAKKAEEVLFTVDGAQVGVEEFMYVYKKNNINNDSAYTKTDIDDYFDLYVKFKLKIEEALSLGMDTTQSFTSEFNTYKEQLKKPYLTETKVTDSLVQEAYQRYQQEINASHILIMLDENALPADTLEAFNKIKELKSRSEQGEDFAALAKKYSEDPSSKTNGGNLGYFTSFQMVYPFESAAYQAEEGAISEPVRTKFGYHIIKVWDKRPAQGNVEASHIMIRIKPNKEDSVTARNKIFEIHEQAVGGVSWEELASQFSEDINSKDQGGRLRPFSVGQLPFEFQEAAFALTSPGDISDPVMTPYGWHIIRLEGKTPLRSFEEMEQSVRSRINRDTRADLNKKAFVQRLKKENGFKEELFDSQVFLQHVDSTLVQGQWSKPALASTENILLFRVSDEEFRLDNFFTYLEQNQAKSSKALGDYITELYGNFKEQSIIAYEESHLEEKYLDYRMLVKEYREGILLFQLMEDEVWSKAAKDTVGLREFFESNLDKYQWGDRVKATVYNAASAEVLSALKDQLGQATGISKDELEKQFNKESSLTLQVNEGDFEKGDIPAIDRVEWKKGNHEVDLDNRKALVVIHELIPAGPKKLSEVRGLVISDYQNELEKRWVQQLRSKYPVVVNDQGLQYVYEHLL